jgi:hypothetical protein
MIYRLKIKQYNKLGPLFMGRRYSWVQPKPVRLQFLANKIRLNLQLKAEYV